MISTGAAKTLAMTKFLVSLIRILLLSLLATAAVGCTTCTPLGCDVGYINERNSRPSSEASVQAIKVCNAEIDPVREELAEGSTHLKEGWWWRIPVAVTATLGRTLVPNEFLVEKVCDYWCQRSRDENRSEFTNCMRENGWIYCERSESPGRRWRCQRKPGRV